MRRWVAWLVCVFAVAMPVAALSEVGKPRLQEPGPLFRIWADHKAGYIDGSGKMVIEARFDFARDFAEGRAAVNIGSDELGNGGKWGYIDTAGRYILEPQLVEMPSRMPGLIAATRPAEGFSEGLAAVLVSGEWGFIDLTGEMAISPRYQDELGLGAGPFREGLARVRVGGRWGYVDGTGKLVIAPRFWYAGNFSEGLAPVSTVAEWGIQGYINKKGTFAIKARFASAREFSDGLAFVVTDSRQGQGGWIEKTGKMVIGPMVFQRLSSTAPPIVAFSEGLVPREVDGKVGYLDKRGRFAIKPQFRTGGSFSEGLAAVLVGDKWGYIDKTGNLVISPRFQLEGGLPSVGDFRGGLAWVFTDGRAGYIDRTGRFVWRGNRAAP